MSMGDVICVNEEGELLRGEAQTYDPQSSTTTSECNPPAATNNKSFTQCPSAPGVFSHKGKRPTPSIPAN